MNREEQVKEIQIGKKEAQKLVDTAASVDHLMKSRHFNRVILEGYFKEEPVRLTGLLADPEFQSEESQKEIMDSLRSISLLRQYLNTRGFLGDQAKAAIEDMDLAIEEINAEEAEA